MTVTVNTIRYPNGIGTNNVFTSNTAADKWLDVRSADDATSFIYRDDSGARQSFVFDYPKLLNPTSINSVGIGGRARTNQAPGGGNMTTQLRVNGTIYTLDTIANGLDWSDFSHTTATNPDTSLAWTINDVLGLGSNPLQEIVIRAINMVGGDRVEVTQMYLQVNYESDSEEGEAVQLTLNSTMPIIQVVGEAWGY